MLRRERWWGPREWPKTAVRAVEADWWGAESLCESVVECPFVRVAESRRRVAGRSS